MASRDPSISSIIGNSICPFFSRYFRNNCLLRRSTSQYAFIRRFLLKKILPTRFYGVGWMNCHLTLDYIWGNLASRLTDIIRGPT